MGRCPRRIGLFVVLSTTSPCPPGPATGRCPLCTRGTIFSLLYEPQLIRPTAIPELSNVLPNRELRIGGVLLPIFGVEREELVQSVVSVTLWKADEVQEIQLLGCHRAQGVQWEVDGVKLAIWVQLQHVVVWDGVARGEGERSISLRSDYRSKWELSVSWGAVF